MALGGGTFIAQNKILPGTYINFVSVANASAALADRGIAAIGVKTGWGPEDTVFSVKDKDFKTNSEKIFGYKYNAPELKGLRDLFLHAVQVYCYRLDGGGEKAKNTYATAKCAGTRGNEIKIVIQKNVDDDTKFDVVTLLETAQVDKQTVKAVTELKDNDYVTFNKDTELAVTAGTPLAGGTDGAVTGEAHKALLDRMEGKTFNVLGCVSNDEKIKETYVNYTVM